MENQTTPLPSGRHRAWVTTAEACAALGMSRETLRQLRLRGVLIPGTTAAGAAPRAEAPAVAPRECGGHDHGLEPQASPDLMALSP